jgi:hypothetical protein
VSLAQPDLPGNAISPVDDGTRVYVWGWAEYIDVFDKPRRSEIAFEIVIESVKDAIGVMFVPLNRHNSLT